MSATPKTLRAVMAAMVATSGMFTSTEREEKTFLLTLYVLLFALFRYFVRIPGL